MVIIEAVIKATDKYYSIVKTAVERDHVFIGVFPEHLRDIINDFNKTFFAARRLVIPDKKLHIVNGNTYEAKATWDVYGLLLEDWEKVEKNLWGKIETCPIKREQVRFSLEWYNRDDNLGEDYFNNLSRYLRERFSLDVSPADFSNMGNLQSKRKPKERHDAKEGVALACYFLEVGIAKTDTAAVNRAVTSKQTLQKYRDNPEVVKQVKEFKENPQEATRVQKKRANRKA
jgi:hypothetical protein